MFFATKNAKTAKGRTRFVASVPMRRVGTRALPHDRRQRSRRGTLSIADGTKVYVTDGSVGHNSGGNGTLEMSGGEFYNNNNLWLGAYAGSSGTFTQSGGTATIRLTLRLAGANASGTTARGTFVQTGGTLVTGGIYRGTGIAAVMLNGGTITPNQEATEFFKNLSDVTLGANGVTIDTAYNIGAANTTITVQNGGRIAKAGSGTFDLSGLTVQVGENMPTAFDFAVAADGAGVGGFSGLPTVPGGWRAKLSEDGKTCRIAKDGFIFLVR